MVQKQLTSYGCSIFKADFDPETLEVCFVLCALNFLCQKLVIFGKHPRITPSQLKQSKVHCSDVTD